MLSPQTEIGITVNLTRFCRVVSYLPTFTGSCKLYLKLEYEYDKIEYEHYLDFQPGSLVIKLDKLLSNCLVSISQIQCNIFNFRGWIEKVALLKGPRKIFF